MSQNVDEKVEVWRDKVRISPGKVKIGRKKVKFGRKRVWNGQNEVLKERKKGKNWFKKSSVLPKKGRVWRKRSKFDEKIRLISNLNRWFHLITKIKRISIEIWQFVAPYVISLIIFCLHFPKMNFWLKPQIRISNPLHQNCLQKIIFIKLEKEISMENVWLKPNFPTVSHLSCKATSFITKNFKSSIYQLPSRWKNRISLAIR